MTAPAGLKIFLKTIKPAAGFPALNDRDLKNAPPGSGPQTANKRKEDLYDKRADGEQEKGRSL